MQLCKHARPALALSTLPIQQPNRHDVMHRPVSTFLPAPAPVQIKFKVSGEGAACVTFCTCEPDTCPDVFTCQKLPFWVEQRFNAGGVRCPSAIYPVMLDLWKVRARSNLNLKSGRGRRQGAEKTLCLTNPRAETLLCSLLISSGSLLESLGSHVLLIRPWNCFPLEPRALILVHAFTMAGDPHELLIDFKSRIL